MGRERCTFAGWVAWSLGFLVIAQCEKKFLQEAKTFQICLGKLVEKVGEGRVAILANETAIDVVGNAEKRLDGTGVNCGGKTRVTPHASAKRRTKGRVMDVFVLLTVRHRKIPLDNDLLSAYAEEGGRVQGRKKCRVQNAECRVQSEEEEKSAECRLIILQYALENTCRRRLQSKHKYLTNSHFLI